MLGHRLHQFVVDRPGSGVAHPQVAHERERRQPGLGLTDEVDREKPHCQEQFGALHHGAGDQRALMPSGSALKQRVGTPPHPAVGDPIAARTTKPVRLARLLQCRSALGIVTVAFEKLGHRQPGLKLDSVHRHELNLNGNTVHANMYRSGDYDRPTGLNIIGSWFMSLDGNACSADSAIVGVKPLC